MSKKGIIDRFEEDWAVVELGNGEFVDVPMHILPPDAMEGSMILIEENHKITVLTEETCKQRDKVRNLMDKLFED
jgi:hypothetical protein